MNWLYSLLIGIVTGLIMKSKDEVTSFNIIAGIAGAIIGGVFFEYIIKVPISDHIDIHELGRYMFFIASFFGAFVIISIKRMFSSGIV